MAKSRLEGKSGDSVIQLQTPFGGGKTHTLIALYHIAREWPAKIVVFDGTALNPKETKPWEELERQLTGTCEITKGDIAPGKEKLIKIISESSPLLILMDEVLEYTTKAAGVKVGDSNLASQTLAFMQELSGAVSTVGNSLLVITLPSSVSEHYDDETSEKLFHRLAKITGRIEKIYTPVGEDEIEHVIRRRLFQNVNEREVKKIVDEVVGLAERGGLLSGDEVGEYREIFLRSFPFKPEVIYVLYKRWGSFPTFQRTRGVLRLLSLVIHDLMDKQLPFIRLGDFNLQNEEIKRELIKHIGQEWDSIIAQDITSKDSGAKKVDESIESTYKPYKLGSVVSATIFMLSFSGRGERGTSVREIKLSTFHPDFQTPVIDTVINQLRDRLFYLSDEGLFFTNQPNLNKIILTREENVTLEKIVYEERELIEKSISRERRFLVYIWPQNHKDIPDTSDLKLIILKDTYPEKEFIERHGENPRVYRNILIFLCPEEDQREYFYKFIRRMLALRSIDEDQRLQLTENQDKEVKNKIKSQEIRFYEELRKYYRWVFIP
ncbi:MAG TPA: ATP-binding protein, partial [candidate division WOR-3 bacterium]|nr:ATP-binding protein [candidate division WOR-3 bacterium]